MAGLAPPGVPLSAVAGPSLGEVAERRLDFFAHAPRLAQECAHFAFSGLSYGTADARRWRLASSISTTPLSRGLACSSRGPLFFLTTMTLPRDSNGRRTSPKLFLWDGPMEPPTPEMENGNPIPDV